MKTPKSFDHLLCEARRHDDYWVADAMHTFTEGLCRLLEENGITKAHHCIKPLTEGLLDLISRRAHYEQYNSPNGWGLYRHFVPFVADVLMACADHPDADVEVSR